MIDILLVEDDPFTRKMMEDMLKLMGFNYASVPNGKEAVEFVKKEEPVLILMDISMPVMNGIEATREIKAMGRGSIIIMLTAFGDEKAMSEAANAGADDFILKPVDFNIMKSRIETAIIAEKFFEQKKSMLKNFEELKELNEKKIEELTEENFNLTFELLQKLAIVSEFRDQETYEHTQRVSEISGFIAKEYGKDMEFVFLVKRSAPLHDIGKIGIRDSILLKPGKLTEEEYNEMKKHVEIGKNILSGSNTKVLKTAEVVAYYHHERWDGTGYPERLKGTEIPIEARIVCLADSIDAMFSKRPYKEAKEESFVKEELLRNKSTQFDPDLVDIVLSNWEFIKSFYRK
ncbi:HD domain-containing phosphohydrolase [Caldisericum exile]|uniref:Response regulator receiver protein n=1 Tax=Caldisericum exile (strain DSM 21853 / NBRC 104410 / AZM16c01) TaxID=511051 RepID=A0A7U6JFM4_CALEA|nr:HD domain-containing phosphohydrolase [Caldisericum exile]BAL81678.1 response regulator receiver protein [Caldisericum exile AZM16c01]